MTQSSTLVTVRPDGNKTWVLGAGEGGTPPETRAGGFGGCELGCELTFALDGQTNSIILMLIEVDPYTLSCHRLR